MKGKQGPLQAIRRSKDPTMFAVVFEDTGALLGLVIAFCGVLLRELTGQQYFDASASILIGVLLGSMAVFLASEIKGLLIGEGYEPETLRQLRSIIGADEAVAQVNRLQSQFLGPNDVMLAVEVKFREELSSKQIRAAVARLREKIRKVRSEAKRIFFAAESVTKNEPEHQIEREPEK